MARKSTADSKLPIHILVDNRESNGPIPVFQERLDFLNQTMGTNTTWETKQLTVGDFVITENSTPKILVERKTWSDLHASIHDGRATSQLKKMMDYRREYGVVLIYIVEGVRKNLLLGASTIAKSFETKLRRIALLSVGIIYTKSTNETVDTVIKMGNDLRERGVDWSETSAILENLNSSPEEAPPKSTAGGGGGTALSVAANAALTRLHIPTTEEQLLAMWQQVPGAGEAIVGIIHENFTVGDIARSGKNINNCIIRISTVANERKVKLRSDVNSVIRHIAKWSVLHSDQINILEQTKLIQVQGKILSAIHGLSEAAANIILQRYSIADLAGGEVSVYDIADIVRPNGRTIGNSLAHKIKDILGVEKNI